MRSKGKPSHRAIEPSSHRGISSSVASPGIAATRTAVAFALMFLTGCKTTQTTRPADDPKPAVDINVADAQSGDRAIKFYLFKGMLTVRAKINGKPAGFFLIDSGASLTAIDHSLQAEFNLPVRTRGTVRGIGGEKAADFVTLEHLEGGGVELPSTNAVVVDMSGIAKSLKWPIKGVIGFDSLKDRPVTFDFNRSTVTFHDPKTFEPPPGARKTAMHSIRRLPAVQASFSGHKPVSVIIDSGFNGSTSVPFAYAIDRGNILTEDVKMLANSRGVGGIIADIRGELADLQVFGLRLGGVKANVEMAPAGQPDGATDHPRFGTQFLRSFTFTFDYPNRAIWVKVNASK